MSEFYIFISYGLEKRLQPLSDKFAMLKVSKSDDEKADYYGEIQRFLEMGKGKTGIERVYKVNARIKKKNFKNEVYVWEMKLLSVLEVPLESITQEIWDKEMSFIERLKITPEIRESIELLKLKKLDPAGLNQKIEREQQEPEVSSNIFKKLARTGTQKFKNQDKTLKAKPSMLLSGAMSSIDNENEGSQRTIHSKKEPSENKQGKLDNKPSLSPEPEKKPLFGGLKLVGKGLGISNAGAPNPVVETIAEKPEKESKPLLGKIGKSLFTKKSSKADESPTKQPDTLGGKEEGGKNTLFRDRFNQLKIQNLSKDNKQEQREQLAMQLRSHF